MLNSAKKINILTLVLSEKKILNETKNHNPPPPLRCKLYGRSLTILIGRMPLVEQLLLISGVQSLGSCCSIFSFLLSVLLALFLSIIVFSVLLQFTDSDYPFGFFQLFLLLAKY